jgi:hypothetical protein
MYTKWCIEELFDTTFVISIAYGAFEVVRYGKTNFNLKINDAKRK